MRRPSFYETVMFGTATGKGCPFCFIFVTPRLFWGPWKGFTFAVFVFVKEDNPLIVIHEMVHVRQWMDGWGLGFWIKYLYYLVRYGYKKNPYEVEAYAAQNSVQTFQP